MIAAASTARTASADDRPASKGFYAEGGIGGAALIGSATDYAEVGPAVGVRLGYDLFSWFGFGLHATASTHEATIPPPPEGEYFQLYSAIAEGRLGFRVGRVGVFAQGGFGVGAISSNVLTKVGIVDPGETFTTALRAGGGLEYQLQNRHYAFGVDGEWSLYPEFDSTAVVAVRGFVRYTY